MFGRRQGGACRALCLLLVVHAAAVPLRGQEGVAIGQGGIDSVYATPALRTFVAEAAERNRIPPDLRSYRAEVETEIGIITRPPDGVEAVAGVEQVASTVRWTKVDGERYEQHVTGYRSQLIGLNLSILSLLPRGWITPTLYGDRLQIQAIADSAGAEGAAGRRPRGSATVRFVHPLAEDRDQVYRYSGGDTALLLKIGGREIPVVRIRVEPRPSLGRRVGVFIGEIDVDATRRQVVRIRGQLGAVGGRRRWLDRVPTARVQAVAYVEYVNAEIGGQVWLPSYQRLELQAALPLLGDGRAVLRFVSRVRNHQLNDAVIGPPPELVAGGERGRRWRLTYAPQDSVARYDGWRAELGQATADEHADDFDDIAPDEWRPTGRARLDLQAERSSDVFHFNRIEGAYTGLGVTLRFRDAAPGLTLRAAGGWAWSERAVRGRIQGAWLRGPWLLGARAGRSLDLTNDFRSPFDSGSTLAALLATVDNYDYVDRRAATMTVGHAFSGRRGVLLRLDGGVGHDGGARVHARRGLFVGDSGFRPNRGVDDGSYLRVAATLEYHPDVNAELMRPGFGALTSYERGSGELDWQRIEVRLLGRRSWGPLISAVRADGGMLISDRPPSQQLFEIGATQNLPGYDYKEFAGDRAVVVRVLGMYMTPYFNAPIRLGRWVLPSISPAPSAGAQAGWAEASGPAARASIARLGVRPPSFPGGPAQPVSRPIDGIRASVNVGVRFFGGALFIGAARPVERAGAWRALLAFAQQL